MSDLKEIKTMLLVLVPFVCVISKQTDNFFANDT